MRTVKTARYGAVRSGTERYGAVRRTANCAVRSGTERYGAARQDTQPDASADVHLRCSQTSSTSLQESSTMRRAYQRIVASDFVIRWHRSQVLVLRFVTDTALFPREKPRRALLFVLVVLHETVLDA